MGKKPVTPVSKVKSAPTPSPPEPSPDPLVEPSILKVAELLRSGRLTAEEMSKPITGTGWARVPPELGPFLESPTLPKLAEILRTSPGLYWHPLVKRQVTYLHQLRRDENEWQRLGWEPKWEDTYGIQRPPEQVAAVSEALLNLVGAHAGGFFPHRRIVWKDKAGKPGRKGKLSNPHPTGEPWTRSVEAAWLDEDFRYLRAAFKAKLKETQGKPALKADAKEWYQKLAQEILEETSTSDGVGWWSGWKEYEVVPVANVPPIQKPPRHVGPTAPKKPKDGHYSLDTSAKPYVVKTYGAAVGEWKLDHSIQVLSSKEAMALLDSLFEPITEPLVVRWKPLNLDDTLDAMLNDNMGRAGHEGRPAYLAYAVLGALLDKEPDEIRNTLDNFRHPRRRKKTR